MLVPWTPLKPSRRERAVRRIGASLALAAAVALLAASVCAEAFDSSLAIVASLTLLAGACVVRPTAAAPLEVGVDRSGALTVRRESGPQDVPELALRCVFAAPWLITLRLGTMWISIWPDSVPGNTYRRLWVHTRWRSGLQSADLPAGIAPGQPE